MNELEKFLQYLNINIKSERTKQTYFAQFRTYWNHANGIINQETLNNFIESERKKFLNISSINVLRYALKTYFKFSKVELEIPKWEKPNKKFKDYLTYEEFQNDILRFVRMVFGNNAEEIEFLLETLFYLGCRPDEICNLKIEDVNFERNYIEIKDTKGKEDRKVPFMNDSFKEKFLKRTQSIKGTIFNLNYQQVHYVFKKLKQELGLKFDFSPKTMRHSFAKDCLKRGIDASYIQKLLGHKDIRTTMIYVEPDEKMVFEVCEKTKRI